MEKFAVFIRGDVVRWSLTEPTGNDEVEDRWGWQRFEPSRVGVGDRVNLTLFFLLSHQTHHPDDRLSEVEFEPLRVRST